ncbi:hypothetical protein RRG08_062480 [Elysia crispata]|uniref:Uncharacterized protein n=1 Tax=Elysia crispata TaxID=231223 RepID=A0AAE1DXJ5_9GAST|nr:hypothetical protein RRG08_062480 [Elysia crispata]
MGQSHLEPAKNWSFVMHHIWSLLKTVIRDASHLEPAKNWPFVMQRIWSLLKTGHS